MSSFIINYILF